MPCCCETVSTSEVFIVERFGKYARLAEAGCICIPWPCEYVAGVVSLRIQELNVTCETKTKDNVFVNVNVSIQYMAIKDRVYSAHYVLADHQAQMRSYCYDTIRATLPTMTLDNAFESKDEVSITLKSHLEAVMHDNGWTILQALVTDLTPDSRVKDAMNEINSSKRMKEAAYEKAEGEKVLKVKRAEAEAESMFLSGVGVARQRKAIMNGLRESIVLFSSNVQGATPKDVMDLLILNQYFDTINQIGSNPGTKVVFQGNGDRIRDGMMQANAGY